MSITKIPDKNGQLCTDAKDNMKTRPLAKIAGVTTLIIAVITAVLVFFLFYCYHHQSNINIKDYLSRYLSQATRSSVSLKKISFSISPMAIEVKGLSVLPGKNQKGFKFDFPDIKAVLCIKGKFGQKELCIKSVYVNGFSMELSADMHLSNIPKSHTSRIPDFIQNTLSYLFFRKITVAKAEINNGRAIIKNNNGTIKVYNINAVLNDKQIIDVACRINASLGSERNYLKTNGKAYFRIFLKTHKDKKRYTYDIDMRTNEMQCILSKNGNRFKGSITAKTALHLIYPRLIINETSVDIKKTGIDLGEKHLNIGKIHLKSHSATLDITKKTFKCRNIHIDSSISKNINLAVNTSTKKTVLGIYGRHINLIKALASKNLIPCFHTSDGDESINIKCIKNNISPLWHFFCNLDLSNVVFANQDESMAGDGLQSNIRLKGSLDPDRMLIKSSVQINIPMGEILYDPFYLDLASNSFYAKGHISANLIKKRILLNKLTLEIKNIIKTKTSICLSNGAISLHINLPLTPLEPLFKIAVLDPFGDMMPVTREIRLAGLVSGRFSAKKQGQSIEIKGKCLLDNGELAFKNNSFFLKHVKVNLPILLHYPAKKDTGKTDAKQTGLISFEVASPPWLPLQNISIPIHSHLNNLYVRTPISIKIPGGDLTLKRLIISYTKATPTPKIQTGISIAIKDTRPFFKNICQIPVKGSIQGNIDPIHIENGTAKSLGKIIARVFGGKITISNVHARNIFTGLPVLALKADIRDLNLKEMTKGTSFGEIDGVLNGYINGLEIACGQVQTFELMLETKKVDSIPQRISIAAVDNIAHIGGGQSPFIGFAGVIAKVFKTLPYSKIGIKASLKNDVFRINGTIKENNVEYIIKRGSLFGVNIVNQNPDNRISFKDMLKRIKRIAAAKK